MARIGIFDSGLGGLSVATSIRQRMPEHDIMYIADSAYAPYGDQPINTIIERVHY